MERKERRKALHFLFSLSSLSFGVKNYLADFFWLLFYHNHFSFSDRYFFNNLGSCIAPKQNIYMPIYTYSTYTDQRFDVVLKEKQRWLLLFQDPRSNLAAWILDSIALFYMLH